MGLALPSSESVLELSGSGFIRHGGSFSQLLTETTPIARPGPPPRNQNLAIEIHNRCELDLALQYLRTGEYSELVEEMLNQQLVQENNLI